MKNKLFNIILLSIACFTIFLIAYSFFVTTVWTELDFDSALNAVVSKNLALRGKYCVDYENDIMFYEQISTGPAVLIPTAFFIKFLVLQD